MRWWIRHCYSSCLSMRRTPRTRGMGGIVHRFGTVSTVDAPHAWNGDTHTPQFPIVGRSDVPRPSTSCGSAPPAAPPGPLQLHGTTTMTAASVPTAPGVSTGVYRRPLPNEPTPSDLAPYNRRVEPNRTTASGRCETKPATCYAPDLQVTSCPRFAARCSLAMCSAGIKTPTRQAGPSAPRRGLDRGPSHLDGPHRVPPGVMTEQTGPGQASGPPKIGTIDENRPQTPLDLIARE